jgi:cellulose synthase/poly-beta-1,6-N-acetylglucosamine synthase-like glycosyltransferase
MMHSKRQSTLPVSVLALGLVAAAAPVLYPVWLAISGRRRPEPEPPAPTRWPGLSVVIPAYREAAVIAPKIEDVRANGYAGELEVIVVADDAATAGAARDAGATVLEGQDRRGKADAINRGIDLAAHEVIALTDADTRLEPGSLSALVRWFEDPTVGAVAGEKRVASEHQGLYWAFESWIKRAEARRGSTIGVVGELLAVRRSSFRPLPDTLLDDLWIGLDVLEAGGRIPYEPEGATLEIESPSLAAEWERRTRTQAGMLDLAWRRRSLLVPGASPVAAELWGHRLMRTLFGPLAHAALIVRAALAWRRSLLARLFIAGHLLTAMAFLRRSTGARLSAPERVLAQVGFLQATALGAIVRFARGGLGGTWPKPERPGASGTVFGE